MTHEFATNQHTATASAIMRWPVRVAVGLLPVAHRVQRRAVVAVQRRPRRRERERAAERGRGIRERAWLRDSLLPAGFYYKAFYKPGWTWPIWAKRIRKIAGLGGYGLQVESRIPLVICPGEHNKAYLEIKKEKLEMMFLLLGFLINYLQKEKN